MPEKENGIGPADLYTPVKLRSMHEQGIISRHPSFIVKWALPILLSLLVTVLAVTWMIRYPEMMRTRATFNEVAPTNGAFYATIELTANNINNVRPGQEVQFRFDEYPARKYGYATGIVEKVAGGAELSVQVLLKDLRTSKNVTIPYKAGMKANAFIIARNMRLLERIFYKSNIVTSFY